MAKLDAAAIAALKALFEHGDTMLEASFIALFDAMADAAEDHGHVATGGPASGTGDAGPVTNLQSGTYAQRPATPAVGDFYITTDIPQLYACRVAETWTIIYTHPSLHVSYVCLYDTKAQNTHGGTFTSGAWQTRVINYQQTDRDNICSIASNQITLPVGYYRCLIRCPAYRVSQHQARLYNITDTALLLLGTSETALGAAYVQSPSIIAGRFALPNTKVLEVQHQATTTVETVGFGLAANFGPEVYTIAEFFREPIV